MSMPREKLKVVWGAVERRGKRTWTPVGHAWVTREGEVVAQLGAFPMSGRIAIREGDDEAMEAALAVEEAVQ